MYEYYNEALCDAIEQAQARNFICIDTETTGVDEEAEILQFSAYDKAGQCIMDVYVRPTKAQEWPEAMAVNGITPERVKNCKTIQELKPAIEAIFNQYEEVVGYNIPFDLRILKQNGISCELPSFDVMRAFAPIYGLWNNARGSYRWQKLFKCAEYYGYKEEGFHNSANDVLATIYCLRKMAETARKNLE